MTFSGLSLNQKNDGQRRTSAFCVRSEVRSVLEYIREPSDKKPVTLHRCLLVALEKAIMSVLKNLISARSTYHVMGLLYVPLHHVCNTEVEEMSRLILKIRSSTALRSCLSQNAPAVMKRGNNASAHCRTDDADDDKNTHDESNHALKRTLGKAPCTKGVSSLRSKSFFFTQPLSHFFTA